MSKERWCQPVAVSTSLRSNCEATRPGRGTQTSLLTGEKLIGPVLLLLRHDCYVVPSLPLYASPQVEDESSESESSTAMSSQKKCSQVEAAAIARLRVFAWQSASHEPSSLASLTTICEK